MDGYVQEIIEEADLTSKNKQRDQANTPASMDLFRIDGTSPDLKKRMLTTTVQCQRNCYFWRPELGPTY